MKTDHVTGTPEMMTAAKNLAAAKTAFYYLWNEFVHGLKPLADERFWHILNVYRDCINTYRFEYRRSNGVEQAAEELMRKALVGEADYSLDEAIQFAYTYDHMVAKVRKRYGKLFEFCGDSFGDLMDSLVLCGPVCLTWKPKGEIEIPCCVGQAMEMVFPDNHTGAIPDERFRFVNFICRGENYCEMMLHDAAKHYWLSAAMQMLRDELPENTYWD